MTTLTGDSFRHFPQRNIRSSRLTRFVNFVKYAVRFLNEPLTLTVVSQTMLGLRKILPLFLLLAPVHALASARGLEPGLAIPSLVVWQQLIAGNNPLLAKSGPGTSFNADKEALVLYLEQFRANPSTKRRLEALDAISPSSPYFPWALFERAQVLYRDEQWDEFFGTIFYAEAAQPKSRFTEKIVLLETLALVRHCQIERARSQLLAAIEKGMPVSPNGLTMAKLLSIGPDLIQSSIAKGRQSRPTSGPGFSEKRHYWPVHASAVAALNSSKLRRHVESLCPNPEGRP